MRMFFAAAAASAAPAAAAAPSQVEAVSAAEYQTGDYGTAEEVETLSIDNGVRVRSGRLQIYTSLPWLRISAPRNVVGGGGPLGLPILIDPTQPGARDLRQGIGDLRFGAAYSLVAPAGFDVTLEGQVKLPTASASRGLGTGELDFNIGAEASRSFGVVTPFATVSYTLPGEPNGYDVRDTLALRGGVALQLAQSVRGAVSYGEARAPHPSSKGGGRLVPLSMLVCRSDYRSAFTAQQGLVTVPPASERPCGSAGGSSRGTLTAIRARSAFHPKRTSRNSCEVGQCGRKTDHDA